MTQSTIAAALFFVCVASVAQAAGPESLRVFQKRILPILQSTKPSSCAECHLSGVDLKDYVRDDQAKTFAALVEQGLVDVKNPERSKLLEFIARRPERPTLVSDDVRKEELAAFRAWIVAAVKDPALLAAKASDPVGPATPVEVVRHGRADRVLASFVENVWVEAARCAACHSSDRNDEQRKKHGDKVSWMTPRDPEATLRRLLDAGLIDVEEPAKSLILLKPTLQVEHGGGRKMTVGDRSYKQFRAFVEDYAASVEGRYQTAEELPRPSDEVGHVSEIWLKITNVPAKHDEKLLQVDLYAWERDRWSARRVATSDRAVFGKGELWQHNLTLTAERDSQWAKKIAEGRLPPGKYKAVLLMDLRGRLADSYQAALEEEDQVGVVEFETKWPPGYGAMTEIKFPGQ